MDQMLFDDLFDDANQICTDQWKCSKRRSQYFRQAREEVRQACIKEMVGWPQCLSTCARKFQDIYNDRNSLKLWRLSPHRSRQHSNPSNWNNLETDDFVRQIWQTTKTCSASSNTSSSSSRRVLSMGSCGRNIYQKNNTMTLTCPRPLRRLTTLVMLSRSKSRMRPAFGVSWLSNLSGRQAAA